MLYFILLVSVLLFAYYLHKVNNTLSVTRYPITNEKISEDLKIVQISDFHNTRNENIRSQLIDQIISEDPDVIVITGDLFDSRQLDRQSVAMFLNAIHDVAPMYFITGNHEERLLSDNEDVLSLLQHYDITILNGNSIRLEENNIIITGICDPRRSGKSRGELPENYMKGSLEYLPVYAGYYNILLSHRPEYFELYCDTDFDLVLTGHAHGGQFILPLIGGLYAPNQGILPKYYAGIHEQNNTSEIISRGIGGLQFPFRINNKPELVVIELESPVE
ncbi:MAG: metallophosphoesterase [Erysipelotrichaceae bacterium]|nr:metallophosphoesterase [Erysipelotrichaceae bacterium]